MELERAHRSLCALGYIECIPLDPLDFNGGIITYYQMGDCNRRILEIAGGIFTIVRREKPGAEWKETARLTCAQLACGTRLPESFAGTIPPILRALAVRIAGLSEKGDVYFVRPLPDDNATEQVLERNRFDDRKRFCGKGYHLNAFPYDKYRIIVMPPDRDGDAVMVFELSEARGRAWKHAGHMMASEYLGLESPQHVGITPVNDATAWAFIPDEKPPVSQGPFCRPRQHSRQPG
jgi:hypothetical protein